MQADTAQSGRHQPEALPTVALADLLRRSHSPEVQKMLRRLLELRAEEAWAEEAWAAIGSPPSSPS